MRFGEYCLETPELVECILSYLTPSDLCALAKTNHFFGGQFNNDHSFFTPGSATCRLQQARTQHEADLLKKATGKASLITAYEFAIHHHRHDFLDLLIKEKTDLADEAISFYRLFEASDANNWYAFTTLLKTPQFNNFDVVNFKSEGFSIVMNIITDSTVEFFNQFIQTYGKPDPATSLDLYDNSPLHIALETESLKMVQAVIAHFGEDWQQLNRNNQTPIEYIENSNNTETVAFIEQLKEKYPHAVAHSSPALHF